MRDPNPEMREMVAGLSSIGKADPIFRGYQNSRAFPKCLTYSRACILAEGCSGQKVSGIIGFLARVETLVMDYC